MTKASIPSVATMLAVTTNLINMCGGECTFTYNFQITVQKVGEEKIYSDELLEENNLNVTFGDGESIIVKCVEGFVSKSVNL